MPLSHPLMTPFPRKDARTLERPPTPLEEDRAPVLVDSVISTVVLGNYTPTTPPPNFDVTTAIKSNWEAARLFAGDGALEFAIRGKFLTGLRARVIVTYQNTSGDAMLDSRAARQVEKLLERSILQVVENGSGDFGLAPLQVRGFKQGVLLQPHHQVYCDDNGFGLTVDASNVPTFEVNVPSTGSTVTLYTVTAELYVEAMFQSPGRSR